MENTEENRLLRRKVCLMIEQVKYRNFEFSAAGVFKINYKMIFSMYGTIVSFKMLFN